MTTLKSRHAQGSFAHISSALLRIQTTHSTKVTEGRKLYIQQVKR